MDNTLQRGQILDPLAEGTVPGIRAFNDMVVRDPRVISVQLPFADGLTLITRRH